MFVHRSNRSEELVAALADIVGRPLRDPFTPELIVVQSRGMERWLAFELSERLSLWANAEFPFPRNLLDRLHALVLGSARRAASPFDERSLSFAIAALLPDLLAEPGFETIARYLAHDRGCALRLQLSDRIARVFDDDAVYRPELLLSPRPESDDRTAWERRLWRALVERHGPQHQAARAERLLHALEQPELAANLPERLCVFGISHLPPLYLRVLSALAARVETHLFLLSPSREYFGDVRPRRARPRGGAVTGHPLVAGLGRLGREFQDLLEESAQYQEGPRDLYVDPGSDGLLHALQSDILHLRARETSADRLPIAGDDRSIAIHVCHGPMREVEVLHDQLTALLEDPSLEPHEIVVMTPDIEAYAEVIEAVFGQSSGRPQIPYSVADRKPRGAHEVALALFALLDALAGRLTASSVLDLLSLASIRRRFGIEAQQVELIRVWVEESNARFCADAEHRAEIGQPALHENTWRFGLDRMLLGYAMQGRGKTLAFGVLPYDAIEGNAGELLGQLASLCDRLFTYRKALLEPRTLRAQCDLLAALLTDFVDDGGENGAEHQLIRTTLASMAEAADAAGFTDPVELRSVRRKLEAALDERLPARGLLARGVTFCQLVPMRSIPFKVVCLIGMNEGAIPGPNAALGLGRPRALSRNRRDDDRYMFLEALLCAREKFILSYVGRSIHDNREKPPSVLVSELIDAIAEGFEPAGAGARASDSPLDRRARIEQRLCVRHKLHAFSAHYFGGGPLFSYAARECEAARAREGLRSDPQLLAEPLRGQPELTELTLDELVAWVTHPLRTFAQRELGLYLGDDFVKLPEREPFEVTGLAGWKLGSDLLDLALAGEPIATLARVARARGDLPLGSVGQLACEKLLPQIERLSQAVLRARAGERLAPLPLSLEVDGVRITGTLRELWPRAHVTASYSRIGKRFEFAHFVRHVVLGAALAQEPRAGYPVASRVIARAESGADIAEVEFAPLAEPEALLRQLLAFVRAARSQPLPFEYESGRAYAEQAFGQERANGEGGLRAAQRRFEDKFGPGEDAYVKLFYPSFASLRDAGAPYSFSAAAELLLAPLFRHRSAS